MDTVNDTAAAEQNVKRKLTDQIWFRYSYMLANIFFLLLCGYVLIFSGSLLLESIGQGWYKPGATEYDTDSFFIGYLLSFASLTGLAGALMVLATPPHRHYRFKVLLFFPALIQTVFEMIPIIISHHNQMIYMSYLLPFFLLSLFVFMGAFKRYSLPYFPSVDGL